MKKTRAIAAAALVALAATVSFAAEGKTPAGRRFEYRSKSPEARKLLFDLQNRIENFQFGAENIALAKRIVALDPDFVMGQYYASIPGSNLDEIQKKTWLGRLHHGTARTLARMGKQEQAWAEVESIKKMIEDGGEEGKQYWPAYHYVAGYVKLEAGDAAAALEHLKQANMQDPFHVLLLARAYERTGDKAEAKKAYQRILDSQWAGIERPLAYPEAKRKVQVL